MTVEIKRESITVRTHPSLALIKYWGKADTAENLPATSSLALTLSSLHTETRISASPDCDRVIINGVEAPTERYTQFFNRVREKLKTSSFFNAVSTSNFPTGAGLASSSSGFAALSFGCGKLIDSNADMKIISEIARLGSASSSRALFEGITVLEKGCSFAKQLHPKKHWRELRVIVGIVKGQEKKISSREAMECSRKTSPLYSEWVKESENIYQDSLQAVKAKNLLLLGQLIRKSYLMMFSTMFTSEPPIFYWEPETVTIIKQCEKLREMGYQAWETIDAGPQVKILCLEKEANILLQKLKDSCSATQFVISEVGHGPQIL